MSRLYNVKWRYGAFTIVPCVEFSSDPCLGLDKPNYLLSAVFVDEA
jgi:hypothetical protein